MPLNLKEFMEYAVYREAIASVSLSHPEDCGCIVCCAAQGNENAFVEVVDLLERDHEQTKLPKR